MAKPPLKSDYKWGDFVVIDMKECPARKKLLKYFEDGGRIKATIECEIWDVFNNFDGTGQEFIIRVKKVTIK